MLQVVGLYQEWLETLSSKYTRLNYERHIKRFCKFASKNPDELATTAPDILKQLIISYVVHMKRTAKAEAGKPIAGSICVNSIPIYMLGVQSFLDYCEVSLPWKKIKRMYPEAVTNNLRAYRHEEIQKLLQFTDIRDALLVLIPSTSGIREGGLSNLKLKDVTTLQDGLGMIKVYGTSKKAKYVSFLTPECMAALNRYLEFRKGMHEKLLPESPLIRDKFEALGRRTNHPSFLSAKAVNHQVIKIMRKAGLPLEELQPVHGLRRFFNTVCKNAGIDHMYKEKFMGHSVHLDDVYYDPEDPRSVEKMREEYWKAVDSLTFDNANKLQRKVTELEVKASAYDMLAKRMDALEARQK